MNILYLSPEFPPNYKQFIIHAHQLGARILGIGESDFHQMPEDLRCALSWYVKAPLHDEGAVIEAVEDVIRQVPAFSCGFDMVESHNETWLRCEAAINEHFGVAGIRTADLDRLKRKSVMKQVCVDSGLKAGKGGVVQSDEDAFRLAQDTGFPLILKRDEGVGAQDTFRIGSPEELRKLLETRVRFSSDPTPWIMEEFIHAPIVSYDGLADHQGRILFDNTLVYAEGILEYALGTDVFFHVSRTIPDRLRDIGKKLVQAFGIRRKFFHFEFFVVDGDYIPMEINCRPPGGPILDMMNYSLDDDLFRAWAHLVMDLPVALPGEKKYAVGYVGRRDRSYAFSHEDILEQLGPRLVEAVDNPPLFQSLMGRTRYVFRSPDESEISFFAARLRQTGTAA